MRLPTFSPFPRLRPLFAPAVLLLILVAVSAAIWAGTGPPAPRTAGSCRCR